MILDGIAAILTAGGLVLSAQKQIACWPVWVLGNVLWIIFAVNTRQWPMLALNVFFLGLNVWGFIKWYNEKTISR